MEPNKIMDADLLDILFEGKNKAYGAYELRKTYNKRIAISITGMAVVCLLFFLTRLLANGHEGDRNGIKVKDVTLVDLQPKEPKPEPPIPKLPKPEPVQVRTVQVTVPIIVDDHEVKAPMPDIKDIDDAKIDVMSRDGVKDDGFVAPLVEAHSTGAVEAPKNTDEDYTKIFTKVEREAQFPGGAEAWKRYLQRSLNANIAGDEGAAVGNYTVRVQFIVNREGAISDVEAIEVPKACPGCGPEAVKVIKNGPNWEPAVQNDIKVAYRAVQSITFQVADE